MSWRQVGILWGLAVLLVTTALVWERVAPARGDASTGMPRPLFERSDVAGPARPVDDAPAWPADAPSVFELVRGEDPPLRFERSGDDWRQTSPIEHPVDPVSIQRTIRLVRDLVAIDSIEGDAAEADAAVLGLAPPRARIRLVWGDAPEGDASSATPGVELELELGRTGIGGRAYVRRPGEARVHVVNQSLHARAITMDPREWRDRSIFGDVAIDTATQVELQSGSLTVRMTRDRRTWRLESPLETRVAAGPLDELLREVAAARIGGFVLDDPADLGAFGLGPGALTLAVSVREPNGTPDRRTTLRVGAPAGAGTEDRFGIVEGRNVVIRVPGSLIRSIARDPISWVSPLATGVRPEDVGRIRLLSTAGQVILERAGAGWTRSVGTGVDAPGPAEPTDPARPEALLKMLSTVRAFELAAGAFEADDTVTTVVLEDFAAGPLIAVRIRRDVDGALWLMDSGEGIVRAYPAGLEPPLAADDFPLIGSGGGAGGG